MIFKMIKQRRQWHPTPVLLPGKSHGQRSLVGCSPWGRQESDMTERLHFDFSLSGIGEGYTMEYYSAIKKNTFESVLMRRMKLEPIIQSEVSQKEKHHRVKCNEGDGFNPWV